MKLLLVVLGLLAICAIGILMRVFRLLHGLVVLADRERHVRFLAWVIAKRLDPSRGANTTLAPSAVSRNRQATAPAPTQRPDE